MTDAGKLIEYDMSFSFLRDFLGRALERKRTLIVLGALFAVGIVLGLSFIKTPAAYDFHLENCDRYLRKVCYSERNVFAIFLERTAGCVLLAALTAVSGIHIAALILPSAILLYRAYTFGGSICILCSVYRVSGLLVVFVLYLPVHLLIDAVLVLGMALSCARAPHFCFCKRDFCELLCDFGVLAGLVALVCLAEMLLLLAVFHPIGVLL